MSDDKEAELVPSGDQKRDTIMQEAIQLLLRQTKIMVSAIAHDLDMEPAPASSVAMSVLATTTMLYVRGYPKSAQILQFKELSEYFARMAAEEGEPDVTNN